MESSERPDLVWEGRGMSVHLWLRNTNLSQEGTGVSSKGSEEGRGRGLDVGSAMLDVSYYSTSVCSGASCDCSNSFIYFQMDILEHFNRVFFHSHMYILYLMH